MAINYFQPLNSLRSLSGSAFKPSSIPNSSVGAGDEPNYPGDTDVQLQALQSQRADELNSNITKGLQMAAPQTTQSELSRDIANNPLTGQMAQVKAREASMRDSQSRGFATPEEEAGYKQQQEQKKLNQPIELEKLKSALGIQEQQARNEGAAEVARINAQAAEDKLAGQMARNQATNATKVNVGQQNRAGQEVARLMDEIRKLGTSPQRTADLNYWQGIQKGTGGVGGQTPAGNSAAGDAATLVKNHPELSTYPGSKVSYLLHNAQTELEGFDPNLDGPILEKELRKLGIQ